MVTDPAEVRRLAEARRVENVHFRRYLGAHHRHTIEPLQQIALQVEREIDCRKCANCCRETIVGVSADDIASLAEYLHETREHVRQRYTEADPTDSSRRVLINRDACTFLDGNDCLVYDARPQACRDFPHAHPGSHTLGARLESVCRHSEVCPILYNALEAYKHVVGYHAPTA